MQQAASAIRNPTLQIEFVRHNYDNQQAIIRQLDVKAGVFVTVLVFLVTAALPLSKDVCSKLIWTGKGAVTSWLYVISGLLLAAAFVGTAVCVQRVIRPRGSEHKSLSAGLMFASDILAYGDPEKYHEATEQATDGAVLRILTSETFQLSAIVIRKTAALRVARWPTMMSFGAWSVNSIIGVYILSWR